MLQNVIKCDVSVKKGLQWKLTPTVEIDPSWEIGPYGGNRIRRGLRGKLDTSTAVKAHIQM